MSLASLTGAQKTKLRGLGQTMPDAIRLGKQGLTPAFLTELNRLLGGRELVKLRFEGADRHERAALTGQIEAQAPCLCVGAVGHTALFWRAGPDGSKLLGGE
jgi:RNA-binding protein